MYLDTWCAGATNTAVQWFRGQVEAGLLSLIRAVETITSKNNIFDKVPGREFVRGLLGEVEHPADMGFDAASARDELARNLIYSGFQKNIRKKRPEMLRVPSFGPECEYVMKALVPERCCRVKADWVKKGSVHLADLFLRGYGHVH